MEARVIVRGGGDLATGVARRLHLAGCTVVVLELPQPRAIRRTVCFASAVYSGEIEVESVLAKLEDEAPTTRLEYVSVLVDEGGISVASWKPDVIVDARMLKIPPLDCRMEFAPVVLGLGPGFTAGDNCHAVVETQRGHDLGRVIYNGAAAPDTGKPGEVGGVGSDRLLRSPEDGIFKAHCEIGHLVKAGEKVANVDGESVLAKISGVVRGLIYNGLAVRKHEKIGDIDPRGLKEYCFVVSDKANAIAGGVIEAMHHLRNRSTK